MKKGRSLVASLCLMVVLVALGRGAVNNATARIAATATTLISANMSGLPGNDSSVTPAITADGRYVVFDSRATDLTSDVIDDIGKFGNIFIRDRQTGQTSLVSRALDMSAAGNADSPSVSADGRFVAYESSNAGIVADDDNGTADVFVVDRATGQTTLVSRHSNGAIGDDYSILPMISADGRWVVFVSNAQNLSDTVPACCRQVYAHDRTSGQTTLISRNTQGEPANGVSTYPALSADGRFIAFESEAANLVADDMNGGGIDGIDVYVFDWQTLEITIASRSSSGTQGDKASVIPSISADGRFIAFQSWATNLVTGTSTGWPNIYVRDRQTNQTTLVSRHSDGTPGDYVSGGASISADGRYVAFGSLSSNLVDDDGSGVDAFRHDLLTGQTIMVSRHTDGTPGNNPSGPPLSAQSLGVANSGLVVFESAATNLIDVDENGAVDIFARQEERVTPANVVFVPLVSVGSDSR